MVKYIGLAIAAYLIYRWLRPKPDKSGPAGREASSGGMIEDEMIQDPQCGAYFPRSSAVTAKVDGRTVMFCSEKCRDEYLARYTAK